jgi:Domain of unknown function (DUF4159)
VVNLLPLPARHFRRVRLAAAGLAVMLTALCLLLPRPVRAFGDEGAFHPRVLLVGNAKFEGPRTTAPARWAWELTRRTSAPARLAPTTVRADANALLTEPFAYWLGDADVGTLTTRELVALRKFFSLGGVLFVDESNPAKGAFGKSARRELARVLPDTTPVPIGTDHVVFRSFYLLGRAVGRLEGPKNLEAIVRNGQTQVIFSSHDIAGALAQDRAGLPSFAVVPGGDEQREMATRVAVNIAMFVLCSNYKDDQVHAPFLMRRRARDR